MSQSPTWMRVLILSSIVLCIALAMSASGDDKKKDNGLYASVDLNKISADYKAKATAETALKEMQAQFQAELSRRENMPLLTEEDQKALDALYEKTPRTDADNAKIKEIEDKAKKASDDLQTIRQKKDTELNDQDKKKLTDAQALVTAAQERYTKMKEDLTTRFSQYGTMRQEELMKNVRAAIAKVAEQKGISIVFTSEVALYAGTDITPQVVGELNKK